MLKQFSKPFRAFWIAVFAAALCLSAIAQNQSKPQAQPAAQSSAQTKQGGASLSCDGALDIVPAKAMSFVRKRRPAKAGGNQHEGKQQTPPADSKTQPKPPVNSKSGS